MLVTGDLDEQSNTALHYSVTCAEDIPRVSPADAASALAGLRTKALAERALAVCASWPKGASPGRRDDTGRERRAGADPLRRARSGHAARERRRGREDAAGEPPHRRARLRAHRVAARVRAAAHRRVHRRSDLRHASRNLRRALREELAPAAVARPARRALVIDVDNVAKAFGRRGGVRAVDGVSFTAADGEITGLLGPNGAGKTTLLRMLATLMIPDAGSARIDGHDVVRDRYAVRRRIGVLSDARGLYPRLTARENIRYYGALHGLVRRRARSADRRARRRAGHRRHRRPPRAGLFAGRADEGRDRARARARPADHPARRAHQRPRHHEHSRAARPAARICARRASACSSART